MNRNNPLPTIQMLLCLCIATFNLNEYCNAQSLPDSIHLQQSKQINSLFPLASFVDLQTGTSTPTNIKMGVNGRTIQATLTNQFRMLGSVNLPLYVSPKLIALSSFSYRSEYFSIESKDSVNNHSIEDLGSNSEHSYVFSNSVNVIYLGKIYGKQLTCNMITSFNFSQSRLENVKFKAIASMQLMKNNKTSLYAGFLANPDPAADVQFMPLISFSRWFRTDLLLECYMPAYIYLRKPFKNNSRISAGINLANQTQVYVHPDIPSVSSFTLDRGTIELAGMYQKNLGHGFVFTSKIGSPLNLVKGKLQETKTGNKVFTINQKMNLNVSLGLSYNLSLKNFSTR